MNTIAGTTDMELLQRPFDKHEMRSRAGQRGKTYYYVPTKFIQERLDRATGCQYEWLIISIEVRDLEPKRVTDGQTGEVKNVTRSYWMVHGRLTLPGLPPRDGIGTAVEETEDGAKSAATDAFKGACVRFGMPLQLDEGDVKAANARARQKQQASSQTQNATAHISRETSPAAADHAPVPTDAEAPPEETDESAAAGMITDQQGTAIRNLCKAKNLSANAMAQSKFGCACRDLTADQAADLIRDLSRKGAA